MAEKQGEARLLIVDDDLLISETLGVYLEERGYSVLKAEDGPSALEIIEEKHPDIVLLDLGLPVMSGFEVLEQIMKKNPGYPVIIISGTESVKEVSKSIRLGVWAFITKPLEDFSILDHTISRVVEKIRLLRENALYREHLEQLVRERTIELEEANEKLKGILREREVLLQEVHHRVKNNLQIITSIVSLQINRLGEHTIEEELKATLNRTKSMATVHNLLFHTNSLEQVNLKKLLEGLCTNLEATYPSFRGALVEKDLVDINLCMDTAVPVGLILNELISNAVLHAFPRDEYGRIAVTGKPLNQAEYELRIEDDGVGLAGTEVLSSENGIGFMIVKGLIKQIDGKLTLEDREKGTCLVVVFPVKAPAD